MRKLPLVPCWFRRLSAAALLALPVSALAQALPYLFESDGSGPPNKIYWQTEPGVRYDLLQSPDLSPDSWERPPGYPAVAEGLAMEYAFTPGPKGFFQVLPIDEQPPEIVDQYPAVDGFAVRRFADITVELKDATGIDPSSIQLTVGTLGTFGVVAPELVFADNIITFDSGGDTALGAWGETISATLVVDDTLGNTLTHTWSFRLELEPQTTADIFVFGSPAAQRTGQRVSGPAATLATRYPASAGPQRANDPPPWEIQQVLPDRIIISYEAGGAPTFSVGQMICNLVPATVDEIFYRRVLSTLDDPPNLQLTVMTEDAELTEFASQAAISMNTDSVVFETDGSGNLQQAYAVGAEVTFPRLGYDLSGTRIRLKGSGSEVLVPGLAPELHGSGSVWLDATAEEWSWWLTPRVRAGLEIEQGELKLFEYVLSGQIDMAQVVNVSAGVGAAIEYPIFDLPWNAEPRHIVWLGVIPTPIPIPVFGSLEFDVKLLAAAEAETELTFEFGYRQSVNASFGLEYTAAEGFDWIRSFQVGAPDLIAPDLQVEGALKLNLILKPEVEFLIYAAAGAKVGVKGTGGIARYVSAEGSYVQLEAAADLIMGPSGPAFELLGLTPELEVRIWEGEWPLAGDALAFKTHPQSRSVFVGDGVSFTCAVDSPTPAAFQWFHNDKPIPGQNSRSLFIPRVNSGHAGSYFVRASTGFVSEESEAATLTVQTDTPENLDSDDDGIPDLFETGTGIWQSSTDRGTDPFMWDSDGDGLSDGVETNSGTYVSQYDTGTNPNLVDSDGDGLSDAYEVRSGASPNPQAGFAYIPAGTFQMGDQSDPLVGHSNERPVHSVYVSAFYMGRYEVTKELWDEVRAWGLNNGYTDLPVGGGKAANHPVHSINWYAMVKWCNARSEKENLTPCYTVSGATYKTGNSAPVCNWNTSGYRLPTEAEWEKAARGGLSGKLFPWGDTINHSNANYRASSSRPYDTSGYTTLTYHPTYNDGASPYSSPVGSFAPNGYGLYDMTGNMWEWCWDWNSDYPSASQTDPHGVAGGSYRMVRGGSWGSYPETCRTAVRSSNNSPGDSVGHIGFRIARSSVP